MTGRREVLGVLAGWALLLAPKARAADESEGATRDKRGSRKEPDAPPQQPAPPSLRAVQEAAVRCTQAARVCLSRCTDHLAAGMANMAQCQRSVMNLLPVMDALATLVGYRSAETKNLKSLAQTCIAFCKSCERDCAPHAKAHEECKACMDACAACIKACDAYVAS